MTVRWSLDHRGHDHHNEWNCDGASDGPVMMIMYGHVIVMAGFLEVASL
jgi:hypothetical protein